MIDISHYHIVEKLGGGMEDFWKISLISAGEAGGERV
jgi:hypothetical protein